MKRKIAIVGANEFQDQLVLKARDLGYETHVFAWQEGAVAKEHADYFYPVSITEKEEILKQVSKIKPEGIISIASDLAVPTVNYVANNLGLTCNSEYSSIVSTNKFEMRKRLSENLLPCPKYILVDENTDLSNINMELPLIVKPLDRSGSRGITKINSYDELKAAIKQAISVSFGEKVLIEEYAEGKEYSMEMMSYQGHHEFLAITEKFTTGSPHFIETMHLEPGRIEENIKIKAIDIMKKSLDALEVKYGASHSEFKVDNDGNIKIIEIGARMGGDCIGSDLVEISTGFDFKKAVIDIATGQKPDSIKEKNDESYGLVKFVFNEEDIDILENIKKNSPESIWRIGNIDKLSTREVTDSSTRFGYYILKANSVESCFNLVNYKENI